MTALDTQRAMERYFELLGSDGFGEAVAPDVSWTIVDTGEVVRGSHEVAQHLGALHAAMQETRTRDLVVGEDVAVLEGDASAPGEPARRTAFCVVYDVREGRVAAMRAYGRIEAAMTQDSRRLQGPELEQ